MSRLAMRMTPVRGKPTLELSDQPRTIQTTQQTPSHWAALGIREDSRV
jgi:hypothetical protein